MGRKPRDDSASQLTPLDKNKICERVKEFEDFLHNNVIGQPRAIDDLVMAYDSYVSGFRDYTKPIFSGLFLGPSGVGKTYLTEMVAEYFFDDAAAFCKVPCEQLSESHKVSLLTGSPPGYVGFHDERRDGGNAMFARYPLLSQWNIDKYAFFASEDGKRFQHLRKELSGFQAEFEAIQSKLQHLSEKSPEFKEELQKLSRLKEHGSAKVEELRKLGYDPNKDYLSVVLFDELERAHRTTHDLILEITDKAELLLSDGKRTSFKNTFLMMTSNINAEGIADLVGGKGTLGFQKAGDDQSRTDEEVYRRTVKEAERVLTAPFLGRLDSVVVFRPLKSSDIGVIFDRQLEKLQKTFDKHFPVKLVIRNEVKDFIIREATDRMEYGARLLKNKINKQLRRWLSRLANTGEISSGDVVHAVLDEKDGKPEINFYKDNKTPKV